MIKHFLVVGVLSLITIQNAFGWGSLGHKTSAKIAWAYLDKNTQEKVLEMLNGGDLSEASVWPDAARANPEWKFSMWYHFEKAPDNFTYLDNLKRQDDRTRKLGGLLEALYIAEDVIKNPASTKEDKAIALKFVVHCIGDIHQPLHTGRVEDNSGNKIPMKWLNLETNLHAIWDSQIIYLGRKDVLANNSFLSDGTADSSLNYANFLMKKYKDFNVTPELFERYDDWMHESMVPRADAYNFKDETPQQYTARFVDVVDLRIYLAGLRIAHVLKRLVYNEASTQPLETLRRAIVEIVGDFTQFVALKPRFTTAQPPKPTEPVPNKPITVL
jgi:hypothetical protein